MWPNHPADFDGADPEEASRPYRSIYLGAAGMAWALHRLQRPHRPDTHQPDTHRLDLAELAAALPAGFRGDPELTELTTGTPPPQPSLLFGESGILLAGEAIDPEGPGARTRHEQLADAVTRNAQNPTRELCWGSPGTMLAAAAMWRATDDPRWRKLWRDSAEWLAAQWEDPVWLQDMYGEHRRYVGAGHGFVSNAALLLQGPLAGEQERARLTERTIATTAALARRDGPLAQWPGLADAEIPRLPVQWCHGAPGIVTALAGLPADPQLDPLLIAGGELTWQAGPLQKGVGLCHGTAGNGYALLALHQRTGDSRWLDRARRFAMDAAATAAEWRARHGQGRYTLFTGDIGVALLLDDCLEPGERAPGLPFLTDPLG